MEAKPRTYPLEAIYTPLRDQVRDEIRNRIIDGRYAPGTRLVERELADQLGVSRLPVREALRIVEAENLVEALPRRGIIVRRLSRTDVEELFDVREALESLACRLAAQRADRAGLTRLRRLVNKAAQAIERNDLNSIGEANAAFHDEVITIAANSVLSGMLEPLSDRMHWLFRQNNDPKRLWAEHLHLYEAIASGDAQAAGDDAVDHVRVNRALALSLLFGGDDQYPGGHR